MWPFIPWSEIDPNLTVAAVAALAAVGALISTQIWSLLQSRAQIRWRMATLKQENLNKITASGSRLVGLLVSRAQLSSVSQTKSESLESEVRELENLKFQILLDIQPYGDGAELLRDALQKLTSSRDINEINGNAERMLRLLAALVRAETDEVVALTHGKKVPA